MVIRAAPDKDEALQKRSPGGEFSSASAEVSALSDLADVLNASFQGYLTDVRFSVSRLHEMQRFDSVNLALSRIILHEGTPIAIALVAERGCKRRVAAMAVKSQYRSRGIGAKLVSELLNEARVAGCNEYHLEVIEQNTAAFTLYQKSGFQSVRRLFGFGGSPKIAKTCDKLQRADLDTVCAAVIEHGLDNLPWQIDAQTLNLSGENLVGFSFGPAYAALQVDDALLLKSLVVPKGERQRGFATRLLQALTVAFPDKPWKIPVLVPEEMPASLFLKLGLEPEPLAQLQMMRARGVKTRVA